MNKIFLTLITLSAISVLSLKAQSDSEAKALLNQLHQKTSTFTTIQADFELTIDDRATKQKTTSIGSIKIKGEKYYMETTGTKVYFDGKTMWSFMEDINEVTITSSDTSENDFMNNPAKIFTFYNSDFKQKYVGEKVIDGVSCEQIDLFPNNLDQPYSRFRIFINKKDNFVYSITAVGKEGVDYVIKAKNTKFNQVLNDSEFKFNTVNHPGIEIIDLRE